MIAYHYGLGPDEVRCQFVLQGDENSAILEPVQQKQISN